MLYVSLQANLKIETKLQFFMYFLVCCVIQFKLSCCVPWLYTHTHTNTPYIHTYTYTHTHIPIYAHTHSRIYPHTYLQARSRCHKLILSTTKFDIFTNLLITFESFYRSKKPFKLVHLQHVGFQMKPIACKSVQPSLRSVGSFYTLKNQFFQNIF